MERTVKADLRRLADLDTGMRATLAESALVLARAIDSFSEQAESAAQLSAIAKAIQELRTTLAKLVEGTGDDDDEAKFAAAMGAAVRDAEVARSTEHTGHPDRNDRQAAR